MKALLAVLLCFIGSNAFASSADSGVCPWKLPFTISIHAAGSLHRYKIMRGPATGGYWEQDTDLGTAPAIDSFDLTLDTSFSLLDSSAYNIIDEYTLKKDTLQFLFSYSDSNNSYGSYKSNHYESLVIAFAHSKDSIISLDWSEKFGAAEGSWAQFLNCRLRVASLSFDDTSIFTFDSISSLHGIVATDGEEQDEYEFPPDNYFPKLGTFIYNDFTASSVTLSGLFRPTTLSDPSAIVTEARPQSNLAIYSSNGSIACSFDESDHERELELYSPLGVRVASIPIPPNENQASLPVLHPGFYFVRLGEAMKKIFISE